MKIVDEIKSEEINIHSKMETLAKLVLAIDNLYDICKKSGIKLYKSKNNENRKPQNIKNKTNQEVSKTDENIY